MTIPLITSIPPKLSRGNKSEEEIGEIYQKLCIRSWLENDFAPYSFNSNKESSELSRYDGVEYFFLERDASKVAWVTLVRQLADWGFALFDCQIENPHLARFGVTGWNREQYLEQLRSCLGSPTRRGRWHLEDPENPSNADSL